MEEVNFILPETERTINAIIFEATRFFDLTRLVMSALFVLYLALRVTFFSRCSWLDLCLVAVCFAQCVLLVLELRGKFRSKNAAFSLNMAQRTLSLALFVLVLRDILVARNDVVFCHVVACVAMGVGWLLCILGDAFSLTVPRYSQMIVSSFKKDIEVRQLVSRGMDEAKSAAKGALKSDAVKRTMRVGGIILSTGVLAGIAKRIMKR